MSEKDVKKHIVFFESLNLDKTIKCLIVDWIIECKKNINHSNRELIDIDSLLLSIKKPKWSSRIDKAIRRIDKKYKSKKEIFALFENFANYEEFSINILGVEILQRLLKKSKDIYNDEIDNIKDFVEQESLYIPKLDWKKNNKKIKNIFNWPIGMIGLHSSWNDNIDPRGSLSKSKRRVVSLNKISAKRIWINSSMKKPIIFFKNPNGDFLGLSSGAGGALVSFTDKVLKYKRCGYKEGFSRLEPYIDRLIFTKDNNLYQKYIDTKSGFHNIDLAKAEVDSTNTILSIGCRLASIPVAIFSVDDKNVILIQEIESDLRLDELFTYLTNNEKKDITKASGKLYGFLHKKNILRGIGNSWISNDVLMPDGTIGLADVENSFCIERLSSETQDWLKKFERYFYHMSCFNGFDYDTAKLLTKGFDIGYSEPELNPVIDKKILLKIYELE